MTQDTRPLVAVAVPCGDRVHQEFMQCIWGIGRGAVNHRQGLTSSQSSMVVSARNNCVKAAEDMKADYLMFLDSDMTFPHYLINRLLDHKKDIVGCTYPRRGFPFDNLGHTLIAEDMNRTTGLVKMSHMPTGLLLIKMSVFATFRQPIFRFEADESIGITHGEDMVFSRMAREKGFEIWCDLDLSMECAHLFQYALRPNDPELRKTVQKYKEEQQRIEKPKLIVNG